MGSSAVLPAFGLDRRSSGVQNIAEALSDESPQVRQLACNVLGELGADARPSLNGLLARAAEDDEEMSVRVAAAIAIVKLVEDLETVDPGYQQLGFCLADAPLLGGLLIALREAGPVGRKLRQRLQRNSTRATTDEAFCRQTLGRRRSRRSRMGPCWKTVGLVRRLQRADRAFRRSRRSRCGSREH